MKKFSIIIIGVILSLSQQSLAMGDRSPGKGSLDKVFTSQSTSAGQALSSALAQCQTYKDSFYPSQLACGSQREVVVDNSLAFEHRSDIKTHYYAYSCVKGETRKLGDLYEYQTRFECVHSRSSEWEKVSRPRRASGPNG